VKSRTTHELKWLDNIKVVLSKAKGAKRHQACKMPKALDVGCSTEWTEAICYRLKKNICIIILYYINLKYISSQLRLDY
jgi:type III secretory pathway lipoprotein EscJ